MVHAVNADTTYVPRPVSSTPPPPAQNSPNFFDAMIKTAKVVTLFFAIGLTITGLALRSQLCFYSGTFLLFIIIPAIYDRDHWSGHSYYSPPLPQRGSVIPVVSSYVQPVELYHPVSVLPFTSDYRDEQKPIYGLGSVPVPGAPTSYQQPPAHIHHGSFCQSDENWGWNTTAVPPIPSHSSYNSKPVYNADSPAVPGTPSLNSNGSEPLYGVNSPYAGQGPRG